MNMYTSYTVNDNKSTHREKGRMQPHTFKIYPQIPRQLKHYTCKVHVLHTFCIKHKLRLTPRMDEIIFMTADIFANPTPNNSEGITTNHKSTRKQVTVNFCRHCESKIIPCTPKSKNAVYVCLP